MPNIWQSFYFSFTVMIILNNSLNITEYYFPVYYYRNSGALFISKQCAFIYRNWSSHLSSSTSNNRKTIFIWYDALNLIYFMYLSVLLFHFVQILETRETWYESRIILRKFCYWTAGLLLSIFLIYDITMLVHDNSLM